jgi:hypothetical protein
MPVIPENSDPVALTAQADIQRFFVRVVQPSLMEFAPGNDVTGLETKDLQVFLEAVRQNTHNALCYEMRRTFALVIGALFERQLRFWLSGKMSSTTKEIEKEKWPALVERTKTALGTSVIPEMADLETLWSVANAVRHGNGTATTKLSIHAPQLWNQAWMVSKLERKSDLVGNMRISDADLDKYVIAVLRFWHRAGASQVPSSSAQSISLEE